MGKLVEELQKKVNDLSGELAQQMSKYELELQENIMIILML
jgi:hypothetical protein